MRVPRGVVLGVVVGIIPGRAGGDNNPKLNLLLEEKQVFPLTKISVSV